MLELWIVLVPMVAVVFWRLSFEQGRRWRAPQTVAFKVNDLWHPPEPARTEYRCECGGPLYDIGSRDPAMDATTYRCADCWVAVMVSGTLLHWSDQRLMGESLRRTTAKARRARDMDPPRRVSGLLDFLSSGAQPTTATELYGWLEDQRRADALASMRSMEAEGWPS